MVVGPVETKEITMLWNMVNLIECLIMNLLGKMTFLEVLVNVFNSISKYKHLFLLGKI